MVKLSKLMKEGVGHHQCYNDLCHTGPCTVSSILNIYKFLLSNAKYFAPVFLPLVVKIRKLNRQLLLDTCKYYVELVLTGTGTGWTIAVVICVLRHILGEFRLYTLAYLPTMVGALVAFASTPRTLRLFQTSIFQCCIESLLIKRKNNFTKAIANSVSLQTAIFMCCSALILHGKQNDLFRGFWLLTPNEKATHENDETLPKSLCTHGAQSCTQHLMRGVRRYLAIGLTLDMLKMVMSKVPPHAATFFTKLLAKLGNFKIRMTALLVSYMGIYRISHCYFNHKTGGSQRQLNHLMAGFFGGLCYIFFPKPTLLCYAIVLSCQVIWQDLDKRQKTAAKTNEMLSFIMQIPISKLLYPFALAYLVHCYTMRPYYVSSLADAIINGVTNNYARDIKSKLEVIERTL